MEDNAYYFDSEDGLKLYYRDFGAERDGTPVICLPGLTRNSRDFAALASRLEKRRRVITPDFRGRGFSEYDPNWQNYHPGTYIGDTWRLLDKLDIERVIIVGTSLGGLCAMAMSRQDNSRIAGVVMNDVGPEIGAEGLKRIQGYTGLLPAVTTWEEAVEQTRAVYGQWLPGLTPDDWLELARRGYREHDGVPRLDFDPNVGRAVREVGPQKGDPWDNFASLEDTPVTLLWGVDSDILTREICDKMLAVKSDLEVVPVSHRGHVPLLDEPECVAAIDAILDEVD